MGPTAQMVAAGGTVAFGPFDAFWGDRYATVADPFGHQWSFGSPLPPDRAKAAAWKGM